VQEIVGFALPRRSVYVEGAAARRFARAIGERNPVFFEEAAATAAGLASIPVPPTYLFCLSFVEAPEVLPGLSHLNRRLGRALHGAQKFEYFAPVHVGETLWFETSCTDAYVKKGGALEFFDWTTRVINERDQLVARLLMTLIFRKELER
jgi:acyl dehydratase